MSQLDFTTEPEIVRVLADHARRYPLMRPRDVAKLLYQNEFGAAHFSGTEEESLLAVKEELSRVEYDESETLYEEIGNGRARVNFSAVDVRDYPADQLNHDFVSGAKKRPGSMESLADTMKTVREHFGEIGFSFSAKEYDSFMEQWAEKGCPAVSHSKEYREAYDPHYRVIECEYLHDFTEERRASEPKGKRVFRWILIGVILSLIAAGMGALGHYLYFLLVPL